MKTKDRENLDHVLFKSLNEKIKTYNTRPFLREDIKKELMIFDIYLCDMLFHREINEDIFEIMHAKIRNFFMENEKTGLLETG